MSPQPIASYSFLSWARQGLGTEITSADGDTAVQVRGSMQVDLRVTAERVGGGSVTESMPRAVQLYGPGDVVGIDRRMIVRTEPLHRITNFEPNYLPFVEFYEEDFPWRYTPAAPSAGDRRLRPWLALVVLEEDEFEDGRSMLGRPLPYVEVADPHEKLPPFEELWAWAHVHVNGELGGDPDDTAGLADRLAATLREDRDRAYSRLLCPRILRPKTAYHAFLVPSFEPGRLAGLGCDPAASDFATQSAWAETGRTVEPTLYPVYHRWSFATGAVGDFEYLVRLLQPRTVDPRVGRRDMDVQDPGAGLPGIPELGGVLRLGGALRAPLATLGEAERQEYEDFEAWGEQPDGAYPHAFQEALAALVNLAVDYSEQEPGEANDAAGRPAEEDPLILPPLYGRWHSLTSRLVPEDADPGTERWVHELNLDPRFRVAAGFGTEVVQRNEENYMEAAWQQVGNVLEGNARIRLAQLAKLTSDVWHRRELTVLAERAPERFLAVAAPVQPRVLAEGLTVFHRTRESALPPALTSTAMRQVLRPRGRLERLVGFTPALDAGSLLERVNSGEVSAAPPVRVAPELPTGERLARELRPGWLPPELLRQLEQRPWLRFLPFVVAVLVLLLLFPGAPLVALAVGVLLLALAAWLLRRANDALGGARAARALDPEGRTPESVDELATSEDFRIGEPGVDPPPRFGGADSAEAARFKEALRHVYEVDVAERGLPVRIRRPLDLAAIVDATVAGLNPERTVPARVLGSIEIPPRIREQLVEDFGEVMVYPELDLPMYEPLKEISSELFLPNIQLVENNSITLLEPNQRFVESYLVGLNHEFARELLWREYPTDQRGSYFRQFWDVRGFLAEAGADPEALRERLRDVPELHRWLRQSALGTHDHRRAQGDKDEELVLVIRGELLKKYPNSVVYAHRAAWERTGDGRPDKSRPRKLAPLSAAQEDDPPRDLVKTPLYEAKVDPDISFFGFDLSAEAARGGEVPGGEEDPGWFFVIKERPGEPRFGLDVPQDGPQASIHTWNDLAWTDVLTDYEASSFLRVGERAVALTAPPSGSDARPQHDEDNRFRWRADTESSELAYILYQVPVLMAVHAAEMLRQG